jgi:hypothetical protein
VERRRHQVYVTRNTEYHVRNGRVIAVRPRGTDDWLEHHSAIDMEVRGHIEGDGVLPLPGPPAPGQRLYLARNERDVVTSTVSSIERPPKELLAHYPPEAA